jgi:flagellar protein FlaI
MNIRKCKNCNIYRYIEKDGYCRNCLSNHHESSNDDIFEEIENTTSISKEQIESWFSEPDYSEGYEVVRQYWARAPYSFVSIIYNKENDNYRYMINEPVMDASESTVVDEARCELNSEPISDDIESEEARIKELRARLSDIAEEHNVSLEDGNLHKFKYYLERSFSGYGRIDALMCDSNVKEISCHEGEDNIFVYHTDYEYIMTGAIFDNSSLKSFVRKLADMCRESVSLSEPIFDGHLSDESHVQGTLGTEMSIGDAFTIKKFDRVPFTPVDLIKEGTFNPEQLAYLWIAVEQNKNILFLGEGSSGKTTTMNAVSMFIPPKAKVATVEETKEISLPQKNWISGTTRRGVGGEEGGEDIDMHELLGSALQQRPEYIVLGDIRGEETQTLFQAMTTGHTAYSTMHAETVDTAIGRLTNPPINVPKRMITALDIICMQKKTHMKVEGGETISVHRNSEISEVPKLRDDGQFESQVVSQWDERNDNFIQLMEDSKILEKIATEKGWTEEDIRRKIGQRKETLEYLVEKNIQDELFVAQVLQAYMINNEKILKQVRSNNLDRQEIESMAYASFD